MKILFPETGDKKSKRLLAQEVASGATDPFLSKLHGEYSHSQYENPREMLAPFNTKILHTKFPYFGERLEQLWEEADDPSPTSDHARLLDSRRNPRFTYWCAMVSISIAISFGLLATGIGAVQIWITWCTWMDDSTVAQCGYKKPKATTGAVG
jgi:hypothetical protein